MQEAITRSKAVTHGAWVVAEGSGLEAPTHPAQRPLFPKFRDLHMQEVGSPCLLGLQPTSSGESELQGPGRLQGLGALRRPSPCLPIPWEQQGLHNHITLPQKHPLPRWDTLASECRSASSTTPAS